MVRRISKIYINWDFTSHSITLPTDYDIGISEDGINWDYIYTGRRAEYKETIKINQDARYIKLLIYEVEKWTRPAMADFIAYADANVPKLIRFQGNLYEGDNPVNDTLELTFRLYDGKDAEEPLWNETQNVTVEEGIFNVELGSETELDLLFDKPYWLGIEVESDGEMDPRFRLTSSPYAFMSKE